jgi:hypothetical protein
VVAAGDVAVEHKWWEDALEKASANAYEDFMAEAGLQVRNASPAAAVDSSDRPMSAGQERQCSAA